MTIENKGALPLIVTGITSADGQFTINPTAFTVAAGASQNVTVTFTPTSAGTKYSTLTILSNDLTSPTAKLTVNGTATAAPVPIFTFSTGSLTNTRIVFTSARDGNNEIYVMNTDGTGQIRLTNNSAADTHSSWSPDGTKIAFQSDRDGNDIQFNEIYVMNTDGTGQTRLTNNSAADTYPSWSPDGTKIGFTSSRDGNDEIYVMNTDGTGQTRLTNNSASDQYPRWSPDGSKIAFQSNRDGNYEIYVMNTDGSNQARLTNNTADDALPSWSPDGSKIAFHTRRDGNDEIYVMNADGTGQTRLTNNASGDGHPWWSPDGNKIVFQSDRDGQNEVYVMNADGADQTRLINNSATDYRPSWSPFFRTVSAGTVNTGSSGNTTFTVTNRGNATLSVSGITLSGTDAAQFSVSPTTATIVAGANQTFTVTFSPSSAGSKTASLSVAHNAGGSPATVTLSGTGAASDLQIAGKIAFTSNRDGNLEIYTMNADGTGLTRLTNNTASELKPIWSPDGNKIVFESNRDGNYEIYVMNADGSGQTRLTNNSASDVYPCWSPDGTKIAFQSQRDGNNEIYVMNADGSGQTRLTNNSINDVFPSWSPDGTKIAFDSDRDGGEGVDSAREIYVMNADGSGQTRVTNNGARDSNPSWSPDGSKIVFRSLRDGNDEIYVMNSDGSSQTRLTNDALEDDDPSWSPDGTKIIFGAFRDGNKEVYVMNADGTGQSRLTNNAAVEEWPSWLPFRRIGSVAVGSPVSRTMTVENKGNATLTVSAITSSDVQFVALPTTFSVNAGASQNVTVTFTPTSGGTKYSTLTITSNDATSATAKLTVNGTAQAPAISLSPSPISFGSVNVGSSGTQTLKIKNTGNAALSVTTISAVAPFSSSSVGPLSVNAGDSTTVTITFTPAVAGAASGTLTITHNASGSPSSVSLSGTGVQTAPIISLSPSPISFGNVNVGSSGTQTLKIKNTGNAALSITTISAIAPFSSSSVGPLSINAGDSTTVTITFTPAVAGAASGTLTITHNASGSPSTVSLSGTGVQTAPVISLSPSPLSFGSVNVGSSGTQTLKIKNTGNATLSVTTISAIAPFSSSSLGPLSINAGDSTTVTITFTPAVAGAASGTLTITHNASGSPSTVSLSGTGADVTPPPAPTGLTATAGNNQVVLSWVASAATDLSHYVVYRSTSASALGDSIAQVNQPTITYTHTGLSAGTYYYKVKAVDTAGNKSGESNQASATLAPAISLSSVALSLGSANIGSSVAQTFTVSNTGNAALTVSSITASGTDAPQFSVSPTSFTINAGAAAQTVTVTFTPTGTEGSRSATLSVAHNAAGSPASVALSGTAKDVTPPAAPSGLGATAGVNQVVLSWTANVESDLSYYVVYRSTSNGFTPAATDSIGRVDKPGTTFTNTGLSAGTYYYKIKAVDASGNKSGESNQASATLAPVYSQSSSSLSFGAVNVGSSGQQTFTVSNTGTAGLTVSSIAKTGADTSQFTMSPTSFTINAGGQPQTVTVTFTPAGSPGSRSATLSIAHNAAGSPSSVALSGTAQASAIAVSPLSLSFGNVEKGQSAQLRFYIKNTGNTALTVSGLSSSSSQFSFSPAVPPNLNINAGDSAAVTVTFAPTSVGDRSGTITIAHSAGSPASIALSGRGVDTTPPNAPTGLSATAGNGQVTLNWTASAEGDLSHYVIYRSVTDNFTPVSQDSIARVDRPTTTYTNAGLSAGTYYFKIAAADSAGNRSGASAQASATITILLKAGDPAPSSLTFRGSSPSPLTVTVSDSGNTGMTVTPSIAGTDAGQFSVSPNAAATVNPGATQTFTVTFTPSPTTGANRSATLNLTHNATNKASPLTVTLTGDAPPNAPTGLATTAGDGQATLSWTANTESDISYYVIYRSTTNNFTPSAADSVGRVNHADARTVTHTGLSNGTTYYYKLVAVDAGGNRSAASAQASVTPVAPAVAGIAVSPTSLSFGNVNVGASGQQTFTVSNTGTAGLTVSSIAKTGADTTMFSASPTSFTVNAGNSQAVIVTFRPTATGPKSANLVLTHNATNVASPLLYAVSGTGAEPPRPVIAVSATSLMFGDQKTLTFTAGNTGNAALNVTGITVTGSDASQFSVNLTTFTVNAGASPQTVTVTFAPMSAGDKTATLTLSHNAAPTATTTTVSLTGKGPTPAVDRELPFGRVTQSQTAVTKTLDVKNSGGGVLKVTNVIVEMVTQNTSPFELASADRFDVEAGKTVLIQVKLTPSIVGTPEGKLTIRFDPSLNLAPITAKLTATVDPVGTPPKIDTDLGTTRALAWGTVVQSTTPVEKSFKVLNIGGSLLTVSNIEVTGTQLVRVVTATRFEAPVNGSQTVTVALRPEVIGKVENATLTIVSNDPNQGRLTITLTFDVQPPTVLPFEVRSPFNFSPTAYNVPTQATATLQNPNVSQRLKVFDVVSDNSQVVIKSYDTNEIDPQKTNTIIAEYTARPYRATSGFVYVYSSAKDLTKVPWSAKEAPLDTLGVVSALPRDGATNVSPSTSVTIEFSDEVFAFGSRFAAVEVDLQPEPKKFNWQQDASVVGRQVTYRDVPLEPGTTYRLTVLSAVGRRGQELGSSREFLFSTGGSIPATGSIQGTVVFAASATAQQGSRTDTLNAQGGRVFAVDEATKQVVAEQVIGKGGAFTLSRLPSIIAGLRKRYLLYAEVPGRDQAVSVALDRDGDGLPDPVEVPSGGSAPVVTIPAQDVPLQKEEALGQVTVGIDTMEVDPDSTASVPVYADGVQDLKGYTATVQFDTTRLEFVGFDQRPPAGSTALRDRLLLKGLRDGVAAVRKKAVVKQEGAGVTVEGDQVRIEGKLLDGRKGNAVSGSGLLGVLKFAVKRLKGSKPAGLQATEDATVSIREAILASIERRKTAQNVAKVRIRPRAVVQPPAEGKGDVNGDKVVDEGDAILMLRFRAGLTTLTAAQQRTGDVNGDGTLDEGDVILILRFRAGLIPKLPKPVGSGDVGTLERWNVGTWGQVRRGAEVWFGGGKGGEVPLMLGRGIYGGALTLTYDATRAAEVKGPEGLLIATNSDRPGEVRIHFARVEAEEPVVIWITLNIEDRSSSVQRSAFVLRVGGRVFGVDGQLLGEVESVWDRPLTSSLSVAYPNPFNPTTTLRYDLTEEGEVRLTIYNLSGQTVRRLASGRQVAGRHSVVWDGRDDAGRAVATGVYLARLEAGAFRQTQKMLLLK